MAREPGKFVMAYFGFMFLLIALLFGSITYLNEQNQKVWRSARLLTPKQIVSVGELRVIGFNETDSLLIFRHCPGGWFAPPLVLQSVKYLFLGTDQHLSLIYTMRHADGKLTEYSNINDALIDPGQLATALHRLNPDLSVTVPTK